MAQSDGQRKEAIDILSLVEFTTARCHTLLYLPLLNAYKLNSSDRLGTLITRSAVT